MAVRINRDEPTKSLTPLQQCQRLVWNNMNKREQVSVEDWPAFQEAKRRHREGR